MKSFRVLFHVVFFLVLPFVLAALAPLAHAQEMDATPSVPTGTEDTATQSPQQVYYEAMRKHREGDHQAALKDLARLADEFPENTFQDDALYRIGFILEESVQDYEAALASYRKFLVRFGQSRHARLVKNRVEYLEHALTTGQEPLRRYETLRRNAHKQDVETALAEARDILVVYPLFVLRPELLLWQAQTLLREKRLDEAMLVLEQIKDENPQSDIARRSELIQGEAYRDAGHLQRARAMFERLALSEGYGQDMAQFNLKQLEGLEQQEGFLHASFISLFLGLALLILSAALLRVPPKKMLLPSVETFLTLPVMIGFALFSLTQSKMMQPFALKTALVIPLVVYLVSGIGKGLSGKPKSHQALYAVGSLLFAFGALMTSFHWGDMLNQLVYEIEEVLFLL